MGGMVNFDNIIIDHEYSRPFLADLWGYKSFNAISRGVFTPRDRNIIVFFITREKQETLTQYEDRIDYDTLYWEGEQGHGNDSRIINKQDEVHVFYRDKHHSNFLYKGRAILLNYVIHETKPSKFKFLLVDIKISEEDIVAEITSQYQSNQTEREALIKSRVGQGEYRRNVINLWETCSVTGFGMEKVLIASHIKPWKNSNNSERVDPYNSLLLVPTLDKLFDLGYISFKRNGEILVSEKINPAECKKIYLSKDLHLRSVPERTISFLEYHQEYIFELNN
jgi:HNH endonuclease